MRAFYAAKATNRGLDGMKLSLTDSEMVEILEGDQGDKLSVAKAYALQGWLRRCVDIRAQSLAGVPWSISSINSEDPIWESGERPPDSLVWMKNLQTLLRLWEASLTLEGAAYGLKAGTPRRIQEIRYWNPLSITPEMTPRGIDRFRRRVNGRDVYFPVEDVFHVFTPDPYKEQGPGSSVAGSIRDSADVLKSQTEFRDNYLDRGLIKATLLTVEGGKPAPEEVKRFEAWWNRWFSGKKKAGNNKLINAAIKPVVVGEGLKDLSNTHLTEEEREAIATAIGVPHSLVLSNAANFATANADRINFYEQTIIPELRLLEDAINEQLLEGIELQFHEERLEVFQSAELEKAQSLSTLIGTVYTQDEAREVMGLPPISESMEEAGELMRGQENGDGRGALRSMELGNFKTKVKREGIDVDWTPEYLTQNEVDVIKARMGLGLSVEEAFKEPLEMTLEQRMKAILEGAY